MPFFWPSYLGRRFPGRPCPFLSCEEDEKPLVSQSSLHFGLFLSLISLIGQTDFKAEISLFCSFPKNSVSHLPLWLPQAFLFPPQTTKAQRDQIKWHMNNGVFFIFNFPQVLLLMTIVFFFSSHTAAQASHNFFFFKRSHLLTWMAATWKIRLWFSVTFRLFFFCEILYMTCLLRPKKKLR